MLSGASTTVKHYAAHVVQLGWMYPKNPERKYTQTASLYRFVRPDVVHDVLDGSPTFAVQVDVLVLAVDVPQPTHLLTAHNDNDPKPVAAVVPDPGARIVLPLHTLICSRRPSSHQKDT